MTVLITPMKTKKKRGRGKVMAFGANARIVTGHKARTNLVWNL